MRKITILLLMMILLVGSLQVMAKGGPPDSTGPKGSDESQKNSTAESVEEKAHAYEDSMSDLEKEMAGAGLPQQFQKQFMTRLRLCLEQAIGESENDGEKKDKVRSQEMTRIACHAANQNLSPEDAARVCAAYQVAVWAGVNNRFGEALAAEGLKMNQSAEQVEKALGMVARLCQEFQCKMTEGNTEKDAEALVELGRKMARICEMEQLEERLRELLQEGNSLAEAVDLLSN
ncbi:MAG TPA: hypothetical protein DF292_02000 [Firmicutes bacterium]|nr:hypothetical protein [Bacillota bacterium]